MEQHRTEVPEQKKNLRWTLWLLSRRPRGWGVGQGLGGGSGVGREKAEGERAAQGGPSRDLEAPPESWSALFGGERVLRNLSSVCLPITGDLHWQRQAGTQRALPGRGSSLLQTDSCSGSLEQNWKTFLEGSQCVQKLHHVPEHPVSAQESDKNYVGTQWSKQLTCDDDKIDLLKRTQMWLCWPNHWVGHPQLLWPQSICPWRQGRDT